MSEPIKVGDLVMVIRWPHEHSAPCARVGMVGIVSVIDGQTHCHICGKVFNERSATLGPMSGLIPISWMVKIDPPAEPERVETREELTA
jgi:hypothetical protein